MIAIVPGQVFSWDVTKLPGPIKGKYFDCYVMIDIFSRYIVGVEIHAAESAVLAAEIMQETFRFHDTPQVVHSDRDTSMTLKTVAALLSDLEVSKSHSRSRVANDNPYSEAGFKTLKFAPMFPERFGSSPTSTAASRPAQPSNDPLSWPQRALQTRTGSAAPPIRRFLPCRARPGSTTQPPTQRPPTKGKTEQS